MVCVLEADPKGSSKSVALFAFCPYSHLLKFQPDRGWGQCGESGVWAQILSMTTGKRGCSGLICTQVPPSLNTSSHTEGLQWSCRWVPSRTVVTLGGPDTAWGPTSSVQSSPFSLQAILPPYFFCRGLLKQDQKTRNFYRLPCSLFHLIL